MSKEKFERDELYYLLMSSWIYSIEKTRNELLGENIAYTKRIGWNATEYILDHLKNQCNINLEDENTKNTLENIIECLEDMNFIKKGDIAIKNDDTKLQIEIVNCQAEACKELINREVMPQVCLRSIILATLLEKITGNEYSYQLKADPESQPKGICTTILEKQ